MLILNGAVLQAKIVEKIQADEICQIHFFAFSFLFSIPHLGMTQASLAKELQGYTRI